LAQSAAVAPTQRPTPVARTAVSAPDGLLQQLVLSAQECPAFAKLASDYRARFSAPMQVWAEQHLARLDARKVIYPFSGADIVTAMNLFASADHLVLVADQWPQHSAPASLVPQQLAKECQTMSFFARSGYFRTNDLEGKDSVRPRFARLLAYSIALTDAQVGRIQYLTLHEDGQVRPASDGLKPDGLRFSVTRSNGRALTIDYVRTDLSNSGLKLGARTPSCSLKWTAWYCSSRPRTCCKSPIFRLWPNSLWSARPVWCKTRPGWTSSRFAVPSRFAATASFTRRIRCGTTALRASA
jgi:hypothetical protein